MLNRRFLRIKALQEIYAYRQSGGGDLAKAERRLLESVDNLYELFVYQLSFWVEVKRFAERRIEENRNKHFPTEEDLNPNLKFVNNRILNALEDNRHLLGLEEKYKINWADFRDDFIRAFYSRLIVSPEYQEYMNSKDDSFGADRQLLLNVIDNYMAEAKFLCPMCGFVYEGEEKPERCPQCKQMVEWEAVDNTAELLLDFYSDRKLSFNSDYPLAVYLLWKFISDLPSSFSAATPMPSVYNEYKDGTDDKEFVVKLFEKTILNIPEYRKVLEDNISNWDYDRLMLMDKLIIFMALTEFCEFHFIPVKVTINEYIEISKYYSSSDSRRFVNGLLDKLATQLKEEGKLVKTGLGLVDK